MKPQDEKLIGELQMRGLLPEEQLRRVNDEVMKSRTTAKEAILKLNLMKEEDLVFVEAEILGIPFVDLTEYLIDDSIVRLVPEKIAKSHNVIPLFCVNEVVTLCVSDPLNILALDEVRMAVGKEIDVVMSTREGIRRTIDQHYGVGGSFEEVARSAGMNEPDRRLDKVQSGRDAGKAAEDPPIIKLSNMILLQALQEKASDIHIEPEEQMSRVRMRVDGVMHETFTFPKKLHPAVASRFKIMAKIDITETRKPQDGKIRLKIQNKDLDVRVSTFPTVHGENIVMRLLERSHLIGLAELGFQDRMAGQFHELIRRAYGMILVTGPTGAGKTTSLYAALNTINSVDKNIITLEDPVEYELEMIRQTQVNPKAGLTFATGLRSILRQDPDVILVGEIRDGETAEVAIQAALTGHLVFSTLHTNDACGAVTRLMDMGVEPFLISSSLIGVLAQRLVRTICEKCRAPAQVSAEVRQRLGIVDSQATFFHGKGCSHCRQTGYDRRVGIFELLMISDTVKRLIMSRASASEIKQAACKASMITMRADGIHKAEKGVTTLEEVLKATESD